VFGPRDHLFNSMELLFLGDEGSSPQGFWKTGCSEADLWKFNDNQKK
jgi:hypothetical protein